MIGCYLLKGVSVHNFVVENTLPCLSLREGWSNTGKVGEIRLNPWKKKGGIGPNLIKVVPKWNGWWNLSKTGIYAWEITLLLQILFLVLGQVSVTATLKPIVITGRSKCAVALSRNHFLIHLVSAIHLCYSAQRFNLLQSVFFLLERRSTVCCWHAQLS